MLKRILIVALFVGGFSVVTAAEANAWIVRRVAPVRRVVARRVVARPFVRRPVVYARPAVYVAPAPVVYARPVIYSAPAPVVYGPAVSVRVGGGYYGW